MQNNFRQQKIDGALGAMIIEDQPTHSIYHFIVAKSVQNVNAECIEYFTEEGTK
jgi:hypothetical protein